MTTIRSCQRRTSIDCPTLERWCLLIEIRWPYAHIRMCPVPLSTLLHASDLYAGHKEPENVNRLWLIGRHKMQGADDRNRQQEGKKKIFPRDYLRLSPLWCDDTFCTREDGRPNFPSELSRCFTTRCLQLNSDRQQWPNIHLSWGVVGFWWPRQLQNRRHPSQSSRPPRLAGFIRQVGVPTRGDSRPRANTTRQTLSCVSKTHLVLYVQIGFASMTLVTRNVTQWKFTPWLIRLRRESCTRLSLYKSNTDANRNATRCWMCERISPGFLFSSGGVAVRFCRAIQVEYQRPSRNSNIWDPSITLSSFLFLVFFFFQHSIGMRRIRMWQNKIPHCFCCSTQTGQSELVELGATRGILAFFFFFFLFFHLLIIIGNDFMTI